MKNNIDTSLYISHRFQYISKYHYFPPEFIVILALIITHFKHISEYHLLLCRYFIIFDFNIFRRCTLFRKLHNIFCPVQVFYDSSIQTVFVHSRSSEYHDSLPRCYLPVVFNLLLKMFLFSRDQNIIKLNHYYPFIPQTTSVYFMLPINLYRV